jgi:hypothetical protein
VASDIEDVLGSEAESGEGTVRLAGDLDSLPGDEPVDAIRSL